MTDGKLEKPDTEMEELEMKMMRPDTPTAYHCFFCDAITAHAPFELVSTTTGVRRTVHSLLVQIPVCKACQDDQELSEGLAEINQHVYDNLNELRFKRRAR